MVTIELELNKDINQNAQKYFDKAKKFKNKLEGIDRILKETKEKIEELEKNKEKYLERKRKEELIKKVTNEKDKWYYKFRWTKLFGGNIFVIGKDSTTNEILIKKYATNRDLILHSMYPGSPFGLIKDALNDKDEILISKEDILDAGQFLLDFSNAWKEGISATDFFYVKLNQVSKTPNTGEFIKKGSFIIRGKKEIFKNIPLQICLGYKKELIEIEDEKILHFDIMSGSKRTCEKFCDKFIILEPGNMKYKELNKHIKKLLKINIEDLPKFIPNYCKIKKSNL